MAFYSLFIGLYHTAYAKNNHFCAFVANQVSADNHQLGI